MISENIKNIKKFMSALLVKDSFDEMLTTDVAITTYNTFHIDGHIKKAFYSEDEYESLGRPEVSEWKKLRPICFELIKGNKTPLSFKIIFRLGEKETAKLLSENNIELIPENINGLFVNIKYEDGILSYVTGTSLNVFTLDKSLEKAFDMYVSKLISDILEK